MAGPLFWPKMVSAENGFGRTTIFDYSAENVLAFPTFLKCDGPIDTKRTWSICPRVKDSRYQNNHENDTCIKDRYMYCHYWIVTDYRASECS